MGKHGVADSWNQEESPTLKLVGDLDGVADALARVATTGRPVDEALGCAAAPARTIRAGELVHGGPTAQLS